MTFPAERFTEEERERLAPHFTNLDRPVFGLVNLPETVKGALFARYSRYPGTLRRLFLDEFADSVPELPAIEGAEGTRAAELFERIFIGFGDDSVAQLGGAHVACEWTSNLLTKILQRPRLAAYLEQSTRYIAYDAQLDGYGYRYHRDARFGPAYEAALDDLFETYSRQLAAASAWVGERFPAGEGESPGRACARRPCEGARPRPRAPAGRLALARRDLRERSDATSSSCCTCSRIRSRRRATTAGCCSRSCRRSSRASSRGCRGTTGAAAGSSILGARRGAADAAAARLGLGVATEAVAAPSVRLLRAHGTEEELLAALLYESAATGEAEALRAVAALTADERAALLRELVGERENRRHRPGRGFETLRYRFEIVSDYGAFRDLQRHRLLTCQWQTLTPGLGADVPHELVAAGLGGDYGRALEVSRAEYDRLAHGGIRAKRRRTRSASPTGSATSSSSTRARRST